MRVVSTAATGHERMRLGEGFARRDIDRVIVRARLVAAGYARATEAHAIAEGVSAARAAADSTGGWFLGRAHHIPRWERDDKRRGTSVVCAALSVFGRHHRRSV